MKKLSCLLILLSVLTFASSALAEDVLSTAGTDGELNLGASGGSPTLTIGLSPKVVARYATETTATSDQTSQWYAIGTAHPGGNVKYGTAQDLNNIYQDDYDTGTAIDNTILNIATEPSSPSAWTDAGWAL